MQTDNEEQIQSIKRSLKFYKIALCILLLMVVTGITKDIRSWMIDNALEIGLSQVEKTVPHKRKVEKIIKPLRYSLIKDILRENVDITLSFDKKMWALDNMYHFGKDGQLVLTENRYGVCGELAEYTYNKIRPLFGDKYKISFVRAAESGYFLAEQSSHFVLKIVDTSNFFEEVVYILDPSFRRYGLIQNFPDYSFYEEYEHINLAKKKNKYKIFPVDSGVPLLIKKQHLVLLNVKTVNGKLDENNFMIALSAAKRYAYADRPIYVLRKIEGQPQVHEDEFLAHKIFGKKTYAQLRTKLDALFHNVRFQ